MTRDDITLIIAAAGLFLGVINLIRSYRKERVGLKVTPRLYDEYGDGVLTWAREASNFTPQLLAAHRVRFCIEVQNVGRVSVSVTEVGFTKRRDDERLVFIKPKLDDDGRLSKRLEPLSSITAYSAESPTSLGDDLKRIVSAYAVTANGQIFYGTSPILKTLIKKSVWTKYSA